MRFRRLRLQEMLETCCAAEISDLLHVPVDRSTDGIGKNTIGLLACP